MKLYHRQDQEFYHILYVKIIISILIHRYNIVIKKNSRLLIFVIKLWLEGMITLWWPHSQRMIMQDWFCVETEEKIGSMKVYKHRNCLSKLNLLLINVLFIYQMNCKTWKVRIYSTIWICCAISTLVTLHLKYI